MAFKPEIIYIIMMNEKPIFTYYNDKLAERKVELLQKEGVSGLSLIMSFITDCKLNKHLITKRTHKHKLLMNEYRKLCVT